MKKDFFKYRRVSVGLDKTKKKNWIDGDTFAVKIENHSKEYDGRYIILIKTSYDTNKESSTYLYFRAKLTKTIEIPSMKEINELEYIKVNSFTYEYGLMNYNGELTIEEKNVLKSKTDEFGYLNAYLFEIWMRRDGDYSMFNYIGNFDIAEPFDEYIPPLAELTNLPNPRHPEFESFIDVLIRCYKNYNLRKSKIYTLKESQKAHEEGRFLLNAYYFITQNENKIKSSFINGWGPKLYDSDVALDIKADYKKYLRTSKKSNQSNEEMIKELCDYYEDYINDSIDGPLFWIILSDLQMKNKTLTKKQKKKALEGIEQDLVNWKDKEGYSQRKEELDLLKEELENYIFK